MPAKKYKVKPLGNRVLVKQLAEKEGGIVLPEEARKDQDFMRAEVVEIGTELEKLKVKRGDKVLIDTLTSKKLQLDGEDLLLVKSSDVLAILE